MVAQLNSLTIILYTKVFPFLSIFLTALFLYFIIFTPKNIKTMIGAWKSRGAGALMFIANDDGFIDIEYMKGDMGQGIFTGKNINYIVTPRPRYIPPSNEEGENTDHPLSQLNDDDKAQMDGLIQKRHILNGIGKPTYFAYKGKSIGISPSLLNAMEAATETKKKKRGNEGIRILDARTIKLYVPFTFSPSFIDALTFKHEQIGYFSRPMDKIKQNAIPIGLVIIVLFIAYFAMTGKIKIPGLG